MTLRTFILEDDILSRQLVSLLSSLRGHTIIPQGKPEDCPAYRGAHCDCRCGEPCCDILIVFHPFRGMSGLDFLEEQGRSGCGGHQTCKALIAGHFSDEEVRRARALGIRLFLRPLNLQEFDEWLQLCGERAEAPEERLPPSHGRTPSPPP